MRKLLQILLIILVLTGFIFAMGELPGLDFSVGTSQNVKVKKTLSSEKFFPADFMAPMFFSLSEVHYQNYGFEKDKIEKRIKNEMMDDTEANQLREVLLLDDENYLVFYTGLLYNNIRSRRAPKFEDLRIYLFANGDMDKKYLPDHIFNKNISEHKHVIDGKVSYTYFTGPVLRFSRAKLPKDITKVRIYFIIKGSPNKQYVEFKKGDRF